MGLYCLKVSHTALFRSDLPRLIVNQPLSHVLVDFSLVLSCSDGSDCHS